MAPSKDNGVTMQFFFPPVFMYYQLEISYHCYFSKAHIVSFSEVSPADRMPKAALNKTLID